MKSFLLFIKRSATDLLKLTFNSLVMAVVVAAILLAFSVVGIMLLVICTAWIAPIVAGILWHPSWMLLDIPILAVYAVCLIKMQVPHDQSEQIQEA